MQLTLIDKRQETGDVVSFVFQPDSQAIWKAGQFLTLTVPHENPDDHGTEHYFTISSAPYEGVIQITTRLTGSTFKNALNALPLGGSLEAKDIDGDFLLEEPSGEYVFVAGGIGITPFHSILKQLDHEGREVTGLLLYGNRNEDIVFKAELEELVSRHAGLRIIYLIAPEKIDEESIRAHVPDLSSPTFYISGPEPMVESLEAMFKEKLGVPEERMVRDYFPGYDQGNF